MLRLLSASKYILRKALQRGQVLAGPDIHLFSPASKRMSITSGMVIVLQANVALQAERSGGQGISQVTFSCAHRRLRRPGRFLQVLRLVPSRREGTRRRTCKRE